MPKLALVVCSMANRFTASHASVMSPSFFGKGLFTMSLKKSKVVELTQVCTFQTGFAQNVRAL